MPQIQRPHKPTRLALVGQVKDAITHQGIGKARIKIKAAPKKFIEQLLGKLKFADLSLTPLQWYGLEKVIGDQHNQNSLPLSDQALGRLNTIVQKTPSNYTDRLRLWLHDLEKSSLSPSDKFQVLQVLFDGLALGSSRLEPGMDRRITRPDGWFYFVDLPPGPYQLEASVPGSAMGYGLAQAQVEVVEGVANPFTQSRVTLELAPTTLQGKVVSGADPTEPVGMARVQIAETQAYVFSSEEFVKLPDREWNYQFVGIISDHAVVTLIVTAQGYETIQKKVDLRSGANNSLDMQLVPL
jgi:hypothetical protein